MAATSALPGRDEAVADGRVTTETTILLAARDLLAEGGLKALSMRALGERVGLSATAIYHHFDGKDDLVARVVRLGYRRFGEYLEAAIAREPEGSLERVIALGESYVRFAFENREYFRVLFSLQSAHRREVDELPGGGGYHLLRRCVVEAVASGAMRDVDPDLVTHYLWASVHGLVTLDMVCNLESCGCPGQPRPASPMDLFRAFADYLRNGVEAGRPGAGEAGVRLEDLA